MNGVLIVDKPEGITAHDVVARCRKILKTKRIGHTGTLDPFATGVMVVLVGQATRLAQFLDKDAKEYEASVRFGFETETGDRTGERRNAVYEKRNVSLIEIENVLENFRGEIEQTPPMFSAKKVAGKKLYELARKGVEIEREPVKVKIYELEILEPENFRAENQTLELRVACSAGTYIRTLAEDIGKQLKIGAHLAELRRTRAGNFDLSKAVTLEELRTIVETEKLGEILISMNDAAADLPKVVLSETEIKKTRNGMKIPVENEFLENGEAVRLIDENENLVAVGFYDRKEKIVQPRVVFV